MHDIYTKQNTPEYLERFRAQGRIYDKAKNHTQYIVLLSIFVTLILAVLSILFKDNDTLNLISIVYGIVSTAVCYKLEDMRAKRKSLAARIQQLIDSELFEMSWEDYWGEKPTLDEIQKEAQGEPENRFINWYDRAITRVSKEAAIVICFRCNFNYDERLRDKFLYILNFEFWIFIAIVSSICLYADFGFRNIIVNGLAPAFPVIMYYYTTTQQLKSDKENLTSLRSKVIEMQEDLIAGRPVAKKEYSTVQTRILRSRESCLDIPTPIYNKYRTKNEENLSAFANRLADEMLHNPRLANA